MNSKQFRKAFAEPLDYRWRLYSEEWGGRQDGAELEIIVPEGLEAGDAFDVTVRARRGRLSGLRP